MFWELSQNSRGKHLCQSLFFNKVVGLRLTTLLKKGLWRRCFPVSFAKFHLRTTFQDTFETRNQRPFISDHLSGDMYFTCHATSKDHPIEVSCKFMGRNVSQYVKHLGKFDDSIGILIVKWKNDSSKTSTLPVKIWVDWISTTREKMSQRQKWTFWEKGPESLKNMLFFHLMTTFYNFTFKTETIWAKTVEIRNANDTILYV